MDVINSELGKNIVKNIEKFTKNENQISCIDRLYTCTASELLLIIGNIEESFHANSMYNEKILRIYNGSILKFPTKYKGFDVLAVHCWTIENHNLKFPKIGYLVVQ
ncbi:hypothetical protein [Campylobacter sp. W0066.2]|uniref:hypothetical protein n=1 Tax=Campylobacter sp. W0066.2 TaxID=2735752 RepID=UPI002A51BAC9|nr:hypothetical protein [Campylobacter sp. W0066.2]